MSKLIELKVDSCVRCMYSTVHEPEDEDDMDYANCDLANDTNYELDKIPDFCPLPDFPEVHNAGAMKTK